MSRVGDSRDESLARDRRRGFSFELGQDRGDICELSERDRPLIGKPRQ